MNLSSGRFNRLLDKFLVIVNKKGITAVKNGMIYTMPLTTVGSFFLIIGNFPVKAVTDFFAKVFGPNWQAPFNQVAGATFDVVALVVVIGIAYAYAKECNLEPLPAGIISFSAFLIITKSSVLFEGNQVGGVIPKEWTGGKGIICAIIVGITVGKIYEWFIKRDITIKMPPGVPPAISNAFVALIPATVIFILAAFVYVITQFFAEQTFIEMIYSVLQIPLQGLTDSFFGAMMICFLMPFLWVFGVHGSQLVGGLFGPMLTANMLVNKEMVSNNIPLTIENGAKIVTLQFTDAFLNMTGVGLTIGLVMFMAFFAKSKQLSQLGKLSLVPGIFNINEPVLFGVPMVLNPLMVIPFVLNPLLLGITLYGALYFGILPPFSGVTVPWIVPPVISGFILGSWKYAAYQLMMLIVSAVIYYPFFKKQDAILYKQEQESA